jgi:LuxR family maltose regulon positive regulatory protein
LGRKNYFLTQHVHKTTSYRYHPLFREFLISKAQEAMSEREAFALQHRAADLLKKEGSIEAAAAIWLAAENYDAVGQISLRNAKALLEQGRFGKEQARL